MTKDEAIAIIQDYLDLDADVESEFLDALRVLVNPWIPCSERLPEPFDDVLVSVNGNVFGAHLRESKEYFLEHKNRWLIRTENVDAWCEMPKPYEGR